MSNSRAEEHPEPESNGSPQRPGTNGGRKSAERPGSSGGNRGEEDAERPRTSGGRKPAERPGSAQRVTPERLEGGVDEDRAQRPGSSSRFSFLRNLTNLSRSTSVMDNTKLGASGGKGPVKPSNSMEMKPVALPLAEKVKRLPNDMQGTFQKLLGDLQQQESDSMVRFLREARMSLYEAQTNLHDEQEVLSLTAQKITEERIGSARPTSSRATSGGRRIRHGTPTAARPSSGNPQRSASRLGQGPVSARSVRLSGVNSSVMIESERQNGGAERPRTGGSRPTSSTKQAISTISGGGAIPYEEDDEYKQETDEIMKRMSGAQSKTEQEHERQAALVKSRREKTRIKQAQTGETANAMVREATELEAKKQKEKERQAAMMKERKDETKKRLGDRGTPFVVEVHESADKDENANKNPKEIVIDDLGDEN